MSMLPAAATSMLSFCHVAVTIVRARPQVFLLRCLMQGVHDSTNLWCMGSRQAGRAKKLSYVVDHSPRAVLISIATCCKPAGVQHQRLMARQEMMGLSHALACGIYE
jgi:hypothetical protein